jgi:hypothetical protein
MRQSYKVSPGSIKPGRRGPQPALAVAAQPKRTPVMIFNIRLVELTTQEGSADFRVDAESATAAAAIVATAHSAAQAAGTNMVTLPDGQTQVVEAEKVVGRNRTLLLLDDAGAEVLEIPIIDAPERPQ